MSSSFHVCFLYILRCADNSLYAGHTNDLADRASRHNEGRASEFTARRRPVELAYSESHENLQSAHAAASDFLDHGTGRGRSADRERSSSASSSQTRAGRRSPRAASAANANGFLQTALSKVTRRPTSSLVLASARRVTPDRVLSSDRSNPLRRERLPYFRRSLALAPGTRLGAYEITAQIGAGGMGEVYHAS